MSEETKWMPGNGSEGDYMIGNYCSNCRHERWMHHQEENREQDKCEILSNSMLHSKPCYDRDLKFDGWEWFVSEEKLPYCKQFKFWDWDIGDREPEPSIDPNQLCMFTFSEEIDELVKEVANVNKS